MAADGHAQRLAPYLPTSEAVTVLSADWCPYCTALTSSLDGAGITFREVMIEQDPRAEELAAEINGGDWIIPTVIYPDAATQVNPSLEEVRAQLARIADARKL